MPLPSPERNEAKRNDTIIDLHACFLTHLFFFLFFLRLFSAAPPPPPPPPPFDCEPILVLPPPASPPPTAFVPAVAMLDMESYPAGIFGVRCKGMRRRRRRKKEREDIEESAYLSISPFLSSPPPFFFFLSIFIPPLFRFHEQERVYIVFSELSLSFSQAADFCASLISDSDEDQGQGTLFLPKTPEDISILEQLLVAEFIVGFPDDFSVP